MEDGAGSSSDRGHSPPAGIKSRSLPNELLYLIFENLGAKDITSASLVCRTWSEIATTTKWTTSDVQLSHLLMLLRGIGDDHDDHSPQESPASKRCRRLASMITSLRTEKVVLASNDIELYKRRTATEVNLCGGVKSLVVSYRDESTSLCRWLVGSNLTSVQLERPFGWTWDVTARRQCNLIRELASLAHNLQRVVVDHPFLDEIPCLTSSFGQLRFLDFDGYFCFDVWETLSISSPLLEDLKLAGWDDTDEDFVDNLPRRMVTFPSLRGMDFMDMGNDPVALGIVRCSIFPQLRSFSLSTEYDRFHIPFFDYLQPLVNHSPLLEQLKLQGNSVHDPDLMDDPALTPIQNLDSFSNLSSLTLLLDGRRERVFKEMHRMIPRPLPALKRLVLLRQNEAIHSPLEYPTGGWRVPAGLHIADLQPLLAKTKALQSLEILMDATSLPRNFDAAYQAPHIKSLALRPIFVNHDQIEQTAEALMRIFPGVSSLEGTVSHPEEDCDWVDESDEDDDDNDDSFVGEEDGEGLCGEAFKEFKASFFASAHHG